MVKKETKKVIKIIILLIVVLTLIASVISIYMKRQMADESNNYTVKTIMKKYDITLLKTKPSKTEGFDKDYYVKFDENFMKNPGPDGDMLFGNILSNISIKMNYKDYRLIDEDLKITVTVKFNNKTLNYKINGKSGSEYFASSYSKSELARLEVEKPISVTMNPGLVNDLINVNWDRNKIAFFNQYKPDNKFDDYEIYSQFGIKVKIVNAKVFNIVFDSKYKQAIINNIKTETKKDDIIRVLGNPTFIGGDIDTAYGYLTDKFYIFFRKGIISIYPVETITKAKNDMLVQLLNQVKSTNDYYEFINKLTDKIPEYANYERNREGLNIEYPQYGFSIRMVFNTMKIPEFVVYDNYRGKLPDGQTIVEAKNSGKVPDNTLMNLTLNAMYQYELDRISKEYAGRNLFIANTDPAKNITKTEGRIYNAIYSNNTSSKILIYSKDGTNKDKEVTVKGLTSMMFYGDNYLLIGLYQNGIYKYDIRQEKLEPIVIGTDTFKLKRLDGNNLLYDNKSIDLLKKVNREG